MFLSVCSFALPVLSTDLDSVKVPLNILRGSGTTWSGKVYYKYTVGAITILSTSALQ